jgi:hypothetical protein
LVDLTKILPPAPKTMNTRKLPTDLRTLSGAIRRWSISDDEQRADAIARASGKSLFALHDAVSPHWEAINRHLAASTDPHLEADLHSLAQAAMEAEVELRRRGGGRV